MVKGDDAAGKPLASGSALWRLNQLGLLTVRQDLKVRQPVTRDDANWLLQRAIELGFWKPAPRFPKPPTLR